MDRMTVKLTGMKVWMKPNLVYEDSEPMRKYRALTGEPFRILKKEELDIYCSGEIQDLHWIFLKLGDLKARSGARKIHLYVRDLSPLRPKIAHEFAQMNPIVTDLTYVSEMIEVPPHGYSIESDNFDYCLDPMPILVNGERIENWIPELQTDYAYPLDLPKVKSLECSVVYYGDHIAEMNWASMWGDLDWVSLTKALSEKGEIIAVGFECDRSKIESIKRFKIDAIDVVGKISFRESMRLCLGAKLVVGSISGLTVVSASRGARTVILWPSKNAAIRLPERMWRGWIDEKPLYRPLAYDSKAADVIKECLSIYRG